MHSWQTVTNSVCDTQHTFANKDGIHQKQHKHRKKVQGGNDQETAQSERKSLSKNRGGKTLN